MLLTIKEFGGTAPKIKDPSALPVNKAQTAINCRFDKDGITPIYKDTYVKDTVLSDIKSLFLYRDNGTKYFFEWNTDVNAVKTPLKNDSWNRVFFTENGNLRVTDNQIFNGAGSGAFPHDSLNPTPPAPTLQPFVDAQAGVPITGITIITANNLNAGGSHESDGTYDLVFTGTGGSGTTGKYTIASDVVTAAWIINPGTGWELQQMSWGWIVACAAHTQHGGAVFSLSFPDPTLIETRAYVYTFVNKYGEEGAPSEPSNFINVYDGNSALISNISVSSWDNLSDFAITRQRLYRINQTASGTAQYQFVVELDIAATTFTDTIMDSALAETLPSLEWDSAPQGITGLIALPNGMLAGFVGNIVCFSEPNYPHVWPVSYQKATDMLIVGLSNYGNTVIVLTQGVPYVVVGNDPATMVMEKVEGTSCLNKRGIVTGDQFTIYPCPDGLRVMGQGVSKVGTSELMTMQDWKSKYVLTDPVDIDAYFWEGQYIAFYMGAK